MILSWISFLLVLARHRQHGSIVCPVVITPSFGIDLRMMCSITSCVNRRWHPDQQMQNMEHKTQTSTIQVRQDQPMRKQTYKASLTKKDINENRQSISAPPYRTGMLIGDNYPFFWN
jgi:glycyl-tRNA synthetase (class II)